VERGLPALVMPKHAEGTRGRVRSPWGKNLIGATAARRRGTRAASPRNAQTRRRHARARAVPEKIIRVRGWDPHPGAKRGKDPRCPSPPCAFRGRALKESIVKRRDGCRPSCGNTRGWQPQVHGDEPSPLHGIRSSSIAQVPYHRRDIEIVPEIGRRHRAETAAAVGARCCALSKKRRIVNFSFSSNLRR